jgi:hypothetical protein
MSGVLFIICIPREEYEKCLLTKESVHIEKINSSNGKRGSGIKKLQQQESLSSDESSSTTKVSSNYKQRISSHVFE